MGKHWIIRAPDNIETLDPDHCSREFVSERQARTVAAKLAEANPGQRFVVYEALAVMVTGGVSVTNL